MIPTKKEWILSFSTQVHQKLIISWRFFLQTCASELKARSNSSEPCISINISTFYCIVLEDSD
jgi:hypothetical protein